MLKVLAIGALLTCANAAIAVEKLSLNDIPMLLDKLRDCQVTQSILGTRSLSCQLGKPWVSVDPGGRVTIFYKKEGGAEANGSGITLEAALQDLVRKLNVIGGDAKRAVESISDLLPTQ